MSNHLVEVKVWGRYACFTRPENKVERLSYPIITPSAAVGVLESIYWKPQFRWEITEIGVLPHPDRNGKVDWENYIPITLNELAPKDEPQEWTDGPDMEADRVQRTCQVLRWPCYDIRARVAFGFANTTNPAAIKRQFDYRVQYGQCHRQPYLGLREFTAFFAPPDCLPAPIDIQDGGRILHSANLQEGAARVQYRFVPLRMARGWFDVTGAMNNDLA
jgi:CRISPR-associated protein Cas5d